MGEQESYVIISTEWGLVGLLGNKKGLRRLILPLPSVEQVEHHLLGGFCTHIEPGFYRPLQQAIVDYFRGEPVDFSPYKVCLDGASDFTRRILKVCRAIEYGRTSTYSQLAVFAGVPRAARAVGRALAVNPVPLVIPCHRVLRMDGSLGGFSAVQGTALKEKMLQLESDAALV
ncbi:MAG: methylated-DNA--[protein]-cysteine S-methyltransferase [Sedimentisphaerales bacterium]|nr:methylated-DNA--[protein]-cysteine S-methyltransferase [Sedimentisphaerales bacterium]